MSKKWAKPLLHLFCRRKYGTATLGGWFRSQTAFPGMSVPNSCRSETRFCIVTVSSCIAAYTPVPNT